MLSCKHCRFYIPGGAIRKLLMPHFADQCGHPAIAEEETPMPCLSMRVYYCPNGALFQQNTVESAKE